MRLEEVAPAVDRAWTRFWPQPPERAWPATLAAVEGDNRLIETLDIMPFVDWVMHDAPLEGVPADIPLRRAEDARPGDPPTLLDIFAGASPAEQIAPAQPAGQLLEAWRRSVPGVFEVLRTDPGRSAWVRDLFTEEAFEVRDATFSREARPGNVALMRLRPLAGRYEITGDPWAYAATEVPALRAFGEEHLARLRETEPDADWRRLWKTRGELLHHHAVSRRAAPALPMPVTTSG